MDAYPKLQNFLSENCDNEPIDTIVIGAHYEGFPSVQTVPKDLLYTPVPFKKAEAFVKTWEFEKEPAFTAWTKLWLIVLASCDMGQWYVAIPRNPVSHIPEVHGG